MSTTGRSTRAIVTKGPTGMGGAHGEQMGEERRIRKKEYEEEGEGGKDESIERT